MPHDADRQGCFPQRLDESLMRGLRAFLAAHPSAEDASQVCEPPAGLTAYLTRAERPFSRQLLERIRASGLGEVEVYKRAHVDRKLFSKIRSDPEYQPKKATVLAFALALRLAPEQAEELLASAGFALSPSSTADLIVRFFLERGEYDLFQVNDALDAFGQPALMA